MTKIYHQEEDRRITKLPDFLDKLFTHFKGQ